MIFLLVTTITILLLSLYSVSSMIISEVESNPLGKDYKNEWIELYSEEEVNAEYILANSDAGEIYDPEDGDQIKVKFNFQGYYVYNFDGQWLRNTNEKVYLYDETGNTLLDSTNIFDDQDYNNPNTWQRCNGTWEFKESTKGVENCVIEEPPENNETENNESQENNETEIPDNETQTTEDDESGEISSEESEDENEYKYQEFPIEEEEETQENNPLTGSVIKLNSKDIKSNKNSKELDRNNFATIAMGLVIILLLLLLISQRYSQNRKNEFRE